MFQNELLRISCVSYQFPARDYLDLLHFPPRLLLYKTHSLTPLHLLKLRLRSLQQVFICQDHQPCHTQSLPGS